MRLKSTVNINAALETLRNKRVDANLETALDAGAAAAHSVLSVYPSPPAGSRYRRTGNLRQKLRIVKPGKFTRVVEDTASYARFVFGMPQARVHAGRWSSLKDAAEAARTEALDVVRKG